MYNGLGLPPLVWRDFEFRYGLNKQQLQDDQLKQLPEHLDEHDVLIVESYGFFHAGGEGNKDRLKERITEELLNRDYTKDLSKKAQLIFVLSQAHHEFDTDDGLASKSHSWGASQPQQEAYNAVALAALEGSAWTVVDSFSPTKARPNIKRQVHHHASVDGAQFGGVTVPLLHELCRKH
jgi:hypothetical protein